MGQRFSPGRSPRTRDPAATKRHPRPPGGRWCILRPGRSEVPAPNRTDAPAPPYGRGVAGRWPAKRGGGSLARLFRSATPLAAATL
jgi:hypothetical protein